jgi:branched-chain amino acid transport system ATP-binding protein
MTVIRHLREEGIAVLLVEQNSDLALSVADRVYVLDRGTIVHSGDAASLRADPARRRLLLGI